MSKKFSELIPDSFNLAQEFFEKFTEKYGKFFLVEPFNNCREVGWVAQSMQHAENDEYGVLWACMHRNTDRLMIVMGSWADKGIDGKFNEEAWSGYKTFAMDEIDEAVDYAISRFGGTKERFGVLRLDKGNVNPINTTIDYQDSLEDIQDSTHAFIERNEIKDEDFIYPIVFLNGKKFGVIDYHLQFRYWDDDMSNPYLYEQRHMLKLQIFEREDEGLTPEQEKLYKDIKTLVSYATDINKAETQELLRKLGFSEIDIHYILNQ
jgi:hypothetical protein